MLRAKTNKQIVTSPAVIQTMTDDFRSTRQWSARFVFLACSAAVLAFTFSGCASNPPGIPYDLASTARLRVYRMMPAKIIFGDICKGAINAVIDASAPGITILFPNKTLGIPQHDAIPSARYDEYVIPAGGTVTLRYYWQAQHTNGTWMRVGPIYLAFTPLAGADYETWAPYENGGFQPPHLYRISQTPDGSIILKPAPTNGPPSTRCP